MFYNKEEWVYFIHNQELKIGMIGWEAENKEPYYIIYEDSGLNDCSPHGHTDPLYIWKSITESEAKSILPWKYFQTIKMRYKDFISYQTKNKNN